MVSSTEKTRIANYLDLSMWSSAGRIVASQKFRVLADNALLIPPDVADVAMRMREYEIASFGRLVNGFLLPSDAQLTRDYATSRPRGMPPLPAGTTFHQPWKDQLEQLMASDVIRDEWVWHDMPDELYLINSPSLTAADRQILTDLGYADAFRKKTEGRKVYEANPTVLAQADESRAVLVAKAAAGQTLKVAWSWSKKILIFLGALAGGATIIYIAGKTVSAAVDKWLHGDEWRAAAQKAQANLVLAQAQATRIESMTAELDACTAGIANGTTTVEQCERIRRALAAIEVQNSPEGGPRLPSCGFVNCWPYALLALGGGALVGGLIAKKRGWV